MNKPAVFATLASILVLGAFLPGQVVVGVADFDFPDFNKDGFADLAVGVRGEDIFDGIVDIPDAGAVHVIYGSSSGLTSSGDQFWHQDSTGVEDMAEEADLFGSTLAAGDFDGDGYDDLAIGVPDEDVDTIDNAGAVNVLYGSSSGLTSSGNQFWHQDSTGIEDDAEIEDRFGHSLAAGDFDGDGYDDLAIGVRFEDVDTIANAGAVNVLYGSSSGLTSTGDQFWNQDSPGILDEAEPDDDFSWALAAGDFDDNGRDDLAIGVYHENVDTIANAGAVNVIYGSSSGLTASGDDFWHQNTSGILDTSESEDFFGSALAAGDFDNNGRDDLAIGVPGEDVGTIEFAGAVNVLYGSSSGLTSSGDDFWNQNTSGVLDTAEQGDFFGSGLAAGDFDNDDRDDLAIGVSFEDLGTVVNAGAVNVLYGSSSGLTSSEDDFWNQNTSGVLDTAEEFDFFGFSYIVAGDFDDDSRDDLAVGVPNEDVDTVEDAGAMNVLYGSSSGLTSSGDDFWHQDSSGIEDQAEPFDYFGFTLGNPD